MTRRGLVFQVALGAFLVVIGAPACWRFALLTPELLAAEDGGGADSLAAGADSSVAGADSSAAGADSLTADETAEDESERAQTRALRQERFWEAHPRYSVKINRRKDVTNWDSKIVLNKDLSDKISFNLSGSLATRENTTLNRSDASNGTSAGLRYKLNDNVSFSMNYTGTVSAFSSDLNATESADKKKNEDLTISSELSKRLFDAVDISLRAVAGSTSNSFGAVSNQGRKQDLSASVSFQPSQALKVSATYTGNRLFLDSQVDSGRGVELRTEDLTFAENISVNAAYDMLPGVRLVVDLSDGDDQRQHPDPDSTAQETESKSSRIASVTSSFSMIKRLTWDLGARFNRSESAYQLHEGRNNKGSAAQLNGNARIVAWRGATINLTGAREVSRDEYRTASETGDNVHKSLTAKLSQDLGRKADLTLSAISDLTRVAYDDKDKNPKDRDRLSNRVSLDLTYLPYESVSTRLGSEFSQEQSVYVKAAASANNKTTTRYRVTGSYDLKTVREIKVSQTYEIGAVYGVYEFEEEKDNNSLIRNSNISTDFKVPITPGVVLNIDHTYRYQDQGSYDERGGRGSYGRSAGNQSNTLAIGTAYTIGKIRLSMRQAYYFQDNWDYDDGKKVFKSGNRSVEISGRAGFKYSFKDRTNFAFSVEQTRKEGTNVGAANKKFWNMELEASHVF
ncbi:MAG: hypothetical protein WAW06_00385 [bacterium]